MSVEFRAQPDPSEQVVARGAALAPQNPFATWAYAESRRLLGEQPWLLAEFDDTTMLSACLGFLSSGRWTRRLEIPSFHAPPAADVFWKGLLRCGRSARVSELAVGSYASAAATIPVIAHLQSVTTFVAESKPLTGVRSPADGYCTMIASLSSVNEGTL